GQALPDDLGAGGALEGPDVGAAAEDAREALAALVERGGVGVVAGVEGGAAGQEGVREGGAAVVIQRGQPRVDRVLRRADQVGGVVAAAAGAVPDQVVPLAGDGSSYVRAGGGGVPGDEGVPSDHRAGIVVDAAAGAGGGGVAAEGGV